MRLRHLSACIAAACAFAAATATAATAATTPHKTSLEGEWSFIQARGTNAHQATVPGTVHIDLMANGLIEDPFIRMNERGVQWVDKEDWIYTKEFILDNEAQKMKHHRLVFEGLDTYADVYLNDSLVISADNMFRRWCADVEGIVKSGSNTIKVYFHSPAKIDLPKWHELPFYYRASNDQSENGGLLDRKISVFARKAGYHYGWDWGPRLVTMGIWRPAYIESWSDARIENIHTVTLQADAKAAKLTQTVEVEWSGSSEPVTVEVLDAATGKTLASKNISLNNGINSVELPITVKKPRLWWCNGMGEPYLYTFITRVSRDGITMAQESRKVGIRTIKVVTDIDEQGQQFYFVLNGKKVFAKGSNYIPQDNFLTRVDEARYRKTIGDAAAANMNMLRIWGGGIYENDIFYDLCDEQGILIWQDFMFGCSVYPFRGELEQNIRQEAIENVRRLRSHPCMALWCGGNENFDAWQNWAGPDGWVGWYADIYTPAISKRIGDELNRQYLEVLPEVVAEHSPEIFYWPNSPYTTEGRVSRENGDQHYWKPWQSEQRISDFNICTGRFISEYGFQSFPCAATIDSFAPLASDKDIYGDVMMHHQRGGVKANARIEWYLQSEYGEPKGFDQLLYMSQVLQADAMRTAIEAHRRHKPFTMGSLLWQHNDCWPGASWSTRDYYNRWKAAHYQVTRSFDNVLVSPIREGGELQIWVVSDLLSRMKGTLHINVIKLDGTKDKSIDVPVTIAEQSAQVKWRGEVAELLGGLKENEVLIEATLDAAGSQWTNIYPLVLHKNIAYDVNAAITKEITAVSGGYEIKLKTNAAAKAVTLSLNGNSDAHFTDNFIDMIPGREYRTAVTTDMTRDEFEKALQIIHFAQARK